MLNVDDKPLVKWMMHRIKLNKNCLIVVNGPTGCLTGDTVINTNRASMGRKHTLYQLYHHYHSQGGPVTQGKLFNLNIPTYVRSFDGTSIRLHKIIDVVSSGKKQVWKLCLENGNCITGTFDHKIRTKDGFVPLGNLTDKDEVMCDSLNAQKGKGVSYKLPDISIRVPNHPYKDTLHGKVEVHRLIYESYLNKISFKEYLNILWNDRKESDMLRFVDPSLYCIHHKDGCHYNNSIDNLELLSKNDHSLLHATTDETFKHFNQGMPTYSKFKSRDYVGVKETYDIICEEPHHNFVANGIVVHNSGKTYTCISLAQDVAKANGSHFTIEDNLAFNFTDLLKKMEKPENRAPGTVFIFEEVGSVGGGASAREWQSKANKFFFSFMQTSRHRNQIVLMNCPNFSFLEYGARSLVHMQIEMERIDFNSKTAYGRPYIIQVNSRTGKFYFKYPRIVLNGRKSKLTKIKVHHPGMDIAKVYEAEKYKFTTALNKSMAGEEVEQEHQKDRYHKVNNEKLIEFIEKGIKTTDIAKYFGVTDVTVRNYKRKLKEENLLNDNEPLFGKCEKNTNENNIKLGENGLKRSNII